MSYKEAFDKDGKIIIINKDIGECRSVFLTRAHFILRNLEVADFKTVVNKSYLYINIFMNNHKFNSDIVDSLKEYDCSLT